MKYGKLAYVLCASLILLGAAALPLAAQNTFTAAEANVSWYGEEFHGRPTSSGELFDMNAFTAAHKTLPFGTLLELTSLENGRKVIVRINDRGPFVADRELDISKAAAEVLDIIAAGTGRVSIREVSESEAVALVSAAETAESEAPADEPEITEPEAPVDEPELSVPAPEIAVAPIAPIAPVVPVTPAPAVTAVTEAPVTTETTPTPVPAPASAPVPVPAPQVAVTPAPAPVPAPVPAPAPVAAAPVRPAASVQKPAPAVQAAPPAPIIVYTAPAPIKGIGWRIQLGSFTREENATRLVIKLRKAGFNPAFEKVDSMTRVVIAGIPDAELSAMKEKLRLAGYSDYLVRQESW